ncbi:MAG TPA: histidinol-phosphate transaminase [Vicinamibacterales bacterium]
MQEYQRPRTGPGGLRLHLNENTGGPSPRVLEALRALTPEQLAFYPEYDEVSRETAAYLGVPESCLLLTNGLDEGIFIAAVLALQRRPADGPPEAVIVEPTFDMYAISAAACGASVVRVPPQPDFRFPVDATIAAITPRTRVVYVTSPNNPTGVRIANADLRAVARALPPEALLFVDEAYHDFCGDTLIPELGTLPNTVVGRTFAKAHGLAALRAGALVGVQEVIAALRPVIPPYSLNVAAAAALRAALVDTAHVQAYVDEVRRSRELFYAFCQRHGFEYWESGANFVLARVGAVAGPLVAHLRERGIYIRDKSGDPGCEGCIRVTTGRVVDTEQAIAAMEEYLCGVQ